MWLSDISPYDLLHMFSESERTLQAGERRSFVRQETWSWRPMHLRRSKTCRCILGCKFVPKRARWLPQGLLVLKEPKHTKIHNLASDIFLDHSDLDAPVGKHFALWREALQPFQREDPLVWIWRESCLSSWLFVCVINHTRHDAMCHPRDAFPQ